MKRITPRVLGVLSAALLACTLSPAPAHARDAPTAKNRLDTGLFARRKVGRSGAVYCWKPDC